ncbi:MAG TPA: hypothetical protein DHV16_02830 [Nitrospiraceae bacterium]|nr:MAG: hypothetical protein A2Z82_01445 [Nitrospirae bacterium GWA2_46_11]OGW26130.1 MAG: hypothetical protein A2X55_03685 [Nitrospirae bacterium GWB2_47_37]HAK89411.1 hypothetical protein [Nitrospiraceae bacterium]HCZ11196.1 hypothetical protein [Nitrospiraceae bacterium]
MFDTIRGSVSSVIDGDTFDMNISHVGNHNRYKYNSIERVRLADIDKPELNTISGQRSKLLLQLKLLSKEVRCLIQARDEYGRVVAKVHILN